MILNEDLEKVIVSQRKTLDNSEVGILRDEKVEIRDSFAATITGVRRCGKSTFLNQLLKKQKKAYYLNLEDPRLEGFEAKDFNKAEEIMKKIYGRGGVFFFDEIQTVSKWEKFIRYLTDKKEKVVITGSNASLLSREFGTKLTGRHLQTEMFPFSYNEFLKLRKEKPNQKSFEKYMKEGGFPEYLKKKDQRILFELLTDIITKDIAVRYSIKNVDLLKKIAIFLLSNVAKEFSYNSIKKTFKIKSVQTVIDYISFFENAYLLFTLPRFSYSYKQQQVNPKKVYSIDNGLSYNLSTSFSEDKGKMLENTIFLHLRKKHKNIYYFKEKKECDFLIKEKEKITQAIQVTCKLNEENKEREINGLIEAMEKFNLKTGLIITLNQEDEIKTRNKKIKIKPAWKYTQKN